MADHRDSRQQQHVGLSPSRRLVVATLLALAGGLLILSCTTMAASAAGLVVATPVLLLFSPVLVPATLLMALTATGTATSGTLALGAIAQLSPQVRAARKAAATPRDYVEEGKRRVAELASENTSNVDAGQAFQAK